MIGGLQPYAEYQPSGSPRLGNVPAHWQLRKLRTLIRPRNQRNRPDFVGDMVFRLASARPPTPPATT